MCVPWAIAECGTLFLQSSRPKTSGVTVVTDQQEVVKTILQVSHNYAADETTM